MKVTYELLYTLKVIVYVTFPARFNVDKSCFMCSVTLWDWHPVCWPEQAWMVVLASVFVLFLFFWHSFCTLRKTHGYSLLRLNLVDLSQWKLVPDG